MSSQAALWRFKQTRLGRCLKSIRDEARQLSRRVRRRMRSEREYRSRIADVARRGSDYLVESYDAIYKSDPTRWTVDHDACDQFVLDLLRPLAGKRLLDVGCGNGLTLAAAARLGADTYGVDFSAEGLALAKENSPTTEFTQADGCRMPFASGDLDLVLNVGSLEHYLDPALGVREMRRVVRPDGRVLILVPDFSLREKQLGVQEYELMWSERKWASAIERNGLRIERRELFVDSTCPTHRSFVFVCVPKPGRHGNS